MRNIWSDTSGQGLAEYSMILGLAVIVVLIALTSVGENVLSLFNRLIERWP